MPIDADSVSEKISAGYYDLTVAEKKAANYVIAHQEEVQFMSISELAEASGVAEATVSRFCRRLDYKSYNAFKLALAQSTAQRRYSGADPLSGQVETEDSLPEVCRKLYNAHVSALTKTMELLRPEAIGQAVDLMERAKKVLCMGQGGSMVLAEEAAHLFSTASGKFFAVSDSHMQAIAVTNMEEGDVILFFSYSGATRDMLETLAGARERGGKSILITRFPNSPGAGLADVVLQCGVDESPLQLGSARSKIAQIYVTDVLFSELCRRNLADCRASRSRVAQALAAKHV